MSYAARTTVTPERSRMELEQILARYGAAAYGYGYEDGRAIITFKAHDRIVRLTVEIPDEKDFAYNRAGAARTPASRKAAAAQAEKQRWRAMVLFVKAKLEAVESGIVSFEEEFLAHILLPDGTTVGQWSQPQLEIAYAEATMPSLLPGVRGELTA